MKNATKAKSNSSTLSRYEDEQTQALQKCFNACCSCAKQCLEVV